MSAHRRPFLASLAALVFSGLTLTALPSLAAPQPYTDKAFQAAQAAGKPILVDVYANW